MDDLLAAFAAAAPAALADDAAYADPPLPQRLSTEERWTVVALHKDGRSNSYIARHIPCNRRTVADVLSRYSMTGSPGSGARSGRPRATTAEEDLNIAVTARVERFTSPRQTPTRVSFLFD